ncbi:MAG: DsbA family protein [Saprospiraceae bacterium]
MEKLKLIYVYDALCGWCFGFSPVMSAFAEKHEADIEVQVVSGGMIRGERIGPIGEVAAYIKDAYKTVEDSTGVKFGKAFLEDVLEEGSTVFTSIPASVALSVFKTIKPEASLAYAADLQEAIYVDGITPEDFEAYAARAAKYGIDPEKFVEMMQQDTFIAMTEEDFALAQQMGVNGFPTIILHNGEKAVMMARGYLPMERLESNYSQAKAVLLDA